MKEVSTICAPATATGGALSIIRISGASAIAMVDGLFRAFTRKPLVERRGATLTYGHIIDPATGEVVDEVVCSLFRAPHSYTGEDSVEISCHGSSFIQSRIMALLCAAGAELAAPGEFTKRAFLNGKMDLSQAEAVADVIASQTAASHRLAMNQLRGGFGKELSLLREKLLHLTTLLELELDFSDHEDLEFADRTELLQLANDVAARLDQLARSFRVGNAIKTGVPVAIVGQTNAGKSTLLNALLHEDKAIVSDIHGTTRDVIEDTFTLAGTLFRLIDTAGLRRTTDTIENLGIDRSLQKIEQSDIVLWVIDATDDGHTALPLAADILPRAEGKRLLLVFNKTEQISEERRAALLATFADVVRANETATSKDIVPEHLSPIFISARTGLGLDALEAALVEAAALPQVSQADLIVTNARHHEAILAALADIRAAINALHLGLSGDLVSEDLRACINHLGEILAQGTISPDETLQNIFRGFCIGK